MSVRTLVQAPGGLLWIGTDDGVYRYDGAELVPLNALRRGGDPLPATSCRHLLLTPDGQLWIGTESGAFRFTAAGVLHALPLPVAGGATHTIDGLALTPDARRVWVSQDRAGLQAYSLTGRPAGPLLAETLVRLEFWVAPDGSLWLTELAGRTRHLTATGHLLDEWNHLGQFFRPIADPAGRVLLLSGRAAYRPAPHGQLVPVARWRPAGPEVWFDLARTDSTVALLTNEQVWQLHWHQPPPPAGQLARGSTQAAEPSLVPAFTLPLPPVPWVDHGMGLRLDAAGHWWVFLTGMRGAWYREAAPTFIRALAGPGGRPYSVRAVARLPDGRLLVSAYLEGILTQAADSPLAPLRRWRQAVNETGGTPVLTSIVPAHVGPAGEEWLTGCAGPFLTLNPRTGRLRTLPAVGLGTEFPDVRALARDPATGVVWGGARTGLYRFEPARMLWEPYRPPAATDTQPLAGRTIEDLWPDGRGHLWLATPEGVEQLTLATGVRRLYGPTAPPPRRVAADGARCLLGERATGRVWIGTRTHGLVTISPAGRAYAVLTQAQGLPHSSVATITPGPGRTLWLGTYQGLVRYQPATGALAVFTTAHGLVSDECNARAAAADPRTGSLLVGGIAGLHRVWPDRVPNSSARPRLVLSALTALNHSADSSRTRYRLAADPLPALRLAPNQPLVELHLALSGDLNPAQARFAYRVLGWLPGDRWLPVGTTPRVRLQGLPPGTYTVEVRGETGQGVMAANLLRLPLTVTTDWWRRPGAWAVGTLLAMALVWGWQRTRLQRARAETAMRARLAADLHDEVGGLLTRVTMQAELLREFQQGPAPRLDALVEDSRAAASTVRDIIWSVDTAADTLGGLVDRLRDYLDATARATNWTMTLDPTDLPTDLSRPLPPAVRQHTYLIFKEAVTNALRHSRQGTTLTVALRCPPGWLELLVTDDGAPPEAAAATRAGQGLRNMRQRAALLGAELLIGPGPDGGWRLALRVPL